jgi:hypothetical protein
LCSTEFVEVRRQLTNVPQLLPLFGIVGRENNNGKPICRIGFERDIDIQRQANGFLVNPSLRYELQNSGWHYSSDQSEGTKPKGLSSGLQSPSATESPEIRPLFEMSPQALGD